MNVEDIIESVNFVDLIVEKFRASAGFRHEKYVERNLLIWAEVEYGGKSLRNIAKEYDLCAMRVSQIHAKYKWKIAGLSL